MVSYTPSEDDNVRLYEIALLYAFPINQKEETELQKAVEHLFEEAGGKQIFKDVWGRRGLAYKIGGFNEGSFIIYYYELDPSKIDGIDEELRILKGVLRHMIIKPTKNYEIMSYADSEKKWNEKDRLEGERKQQEKEEKKLKQVVEKAKRKTAPKKDDAADKPEKKMTGKALNAELDKLISDSDIEI